MGGEHSVDLVENKPKRKDPKLKPTKYQTLYEKSGKLPSLGTLVPKNMAMAIKKAFAMFKSQHGDIDAFVAKELGYTEEELEKHFAAEQVDALGLAIHNLQNVAGFIIGDQTGIGKGRVNAGVIRWAKRRGLIPVFVTMTPQLYGDMVRDLQDIGMEGFRPLPTNYLVGKEAIELPDGRKLKTGSSKKHKQVLQNVMANGLGEDYDAVFTIYSQIDSNGGPFRREFLMNIAPRALFILDEAHNAGATKSADGKNDKKSRAQFVRDMLNASPNGAFYSSATYAKRPDLMDLYMKTDMRLAVNDEGSLGDAISRGGIPMQQIIAAQLAEAGQYLRRERSWEGAEVETRSVTTDKTRADACARAMTAIMAFDRAKQKALKDVKDFAAGEGLSVNDNSSANEQSVQSTSFSSIMHNLINQSMLSQKVDAIVEEVKAAKARGEKPVITLSNTMGSAIEEYAKINDLKPGDPINITFEDMFLRYLEKTRTISKKEKVGIQTKVVEERQLTDDELGEAAIKLYEDAKTIIKKSGVNKLPVSFIDMIEQRLHAEGISVGEITGRTTGVDYGGAAPVLAKRDNATAVKIKTVNDFNSGELDAVILNSAGSTGISLHASENFQDQRRRVMIVAQPDANIDVFMQTLGRVFRTGQVVGPRYQLLFTDIPAEKRGAAVLAKKMASLNANTSAAKDSDATFKNIPDFLNKYGDIIARQVMEENPDIHEKLGMPLEKKKNGQESDEGAMQKLTGYIPLLPVSEQKIVYDALESAYNDLISQLDAMGALDLEAKPLPLDAKLIDEIEIAPAKEEGPENSPFTRAANLGSYDVKRLGKPLPVAQVKEMVDKGQDLDAKAEMDAAKEAINKKLATLKPKHRQAYLDMLDKNYDTVRLLASELTPGTPVKVKSRSDGREILGIVTNSTRNQKGKCENPFALSMFKVEIAVADPAKKLTFNFSQVVNPESGYEIEPHGATVDEVYKAIESGQSDARETVNIATGNILGAFEKLSRGWMTVFEDHEGNLVPGVMLPKSTSMKEALASVDVTLTPEKSIEFMKALEPRSAAVKTQDKLCVITRETAGYKIATPAAKNKGGQYFLNGAILNVAGRGFVKIGNQMVMSGLSESETLAVLKAMKSQGTGLVTDTNQDAARELMGLAKIPENERKENSYRDPYASVGHSRQAGAQGIAADKARNVADGLDSRAQNASPTRVAQSFAELPASLRSRFANNANTLEGAYDPATNTVWLVADNLESEFRAYEVWLHEQVGHNGLEGLLNESEQKIILNSLWLKMGGMKNSLVKTISDLYGLNPRGDMNDRITTMKEVVAHLAETKRYGALDKSQESVWRKFVNAVKRIWGRIVDRISGGKVHAAKEEIDQLLTSLGKYVFDGVKDKSELDLRASDRVDASIKPGETNSYGVPMERVTRVTKPLSFQELQEALKTLAGKDLPNVLEGLTAQVNQTQRKKIGSQKAAEKSYANGFSIGEHNAAAQITNAWKWAAQVARYADQKSNHSNVFIRRFVSALRVGNQDAFLWTTVKEVNGDLRIYSVELLNEKKLWDNLRNGIITIQASPAQSFQKDSSKTGSDVNGKDGELLNERKLKDYLGGENKFSVSPAQSFQELLSRLRKPVKSAGSPLASLNWRKVAGLGLRDTADYVNEPFVQAFMGKDDLKLISRITNLPHWIAKEFPKFRKIYERQIARVDERARIYRRGHGLERKNDNGEKRGYEDHI